MLGKVIYPMKIVFVTTEYASKTQSAGGLATFTRNIAKMFAEKGNDVRVLLVTTKYEEHEGDAGVIIENLFVQKKYWDEVDYLSSLYGSAHSFDHNTLRANIIDLQKAHMVRERLDEISTTEGVDVVHFCNHGALFRFMDDSIPYVVRISGLYNIVLGEANTIDGSVLYNHKEEVRDIVEACHLKKVRNVLCPSHVMKRTCIEEFGINCNVIQSPVCISNKADWDYEIIDSKIGNKRYFLFFGTISFLKGLGVLMGLVHDLLDKYQDYYLVLAGRDTQVNHVGKEQWGSLFVSKCAKEYNNRVIVLGSLVREELYPVIDGAELCLLPGRRENLSNACLEAMALGKIVVATKDASYDEIIDDGIDGFLCERDNADAFFAAINHVMELSYDEKMQMCKRIKEKVRKLTPEEVYPVYYDYYKRVIDTFSEHKE